MSTTNNPNITLNEKSKFTIGIIAGTLIALVLLAIIVCGIIYVCFKNEQNVTSSQSEILDDCSNVVRVAGCPCMNESQCLTVKKKNFFKKKLI